MVVKKMNKEKAEEYIRRDLYICEEMGDKTGIAYALNNLGNLYTDMGMYDKAQACYSRSLSLFPTQETATKNREFMLAKSGRKWRRPGTFID